MSVSIVIPTRNRPGLLQNCLQAIIDDLPVGVLEVLVINDGGDPVSDVARLDPKIRVLDTPGLGPAGARNLGIAEARGDVCLFTDDDTLPQPGWAAAAVAAMSESPLLVGAAGRVKTPAFDPLFEHSVYAADVGNFLTCNVAYRRAALVSVGGFDEDFPFAHSEDRDLGYRMQELGEVRFEPAMLVVHPPRPTDMRSIIRRGRFVRSEQRLYRFHPQACPPRWGWRWGPLVRLARAWVRLGADPAVVRGSPVRAARVLLLAIGQVSVGAMAILRSPVPRLKPLPEPQHQPALRVAWIGAEPDQGPGAHGVGWMLLERLAEHGYAVDCYISGPQNDPDAKFRHMPTVRPIPVDSGWRYDRWYSNHRTTKLITGLGDRAWSRQLVMSRLVDQHQLNPYDVIFQFSTIEVFGKLRTASDQFPPLVLMPGTHAAGELRWVKRERVVARQCDTWVQRVTAEVLLRIRARRQRRDIHRAAAVFAISQRFGNDLVADYALDPEIITVVPNPIDVSETTPVARAWKKPWRLLFVGRISARKGIELLVELSHRLSDLEGQMTLELIGGTTLWSDYTPLLEGLNPKIATYTGGLAYLDTLAKLRAADLYVHPAKFEPFGLTVGEALACGVPVAVADCVGAAEGVAADCCAVFKTDDVDDFERAVRMMLARLDAGEGPEMALTARSEAVRLFSPDKVGADAARALSRIASQTRLAA